VSERLEKALALIDEANREDPSRDPVCPELPKALVYGWRMSEWLARLCDQPSEALALAARGQHIRRWQVPRDRYAADRAGYLAWRTYLYRFHAEQLAAILSQVGYDAETVERAAGIVAKRRLKQDAEAQTLEDAACLVFLNYEFAAFAESHDVDKLVAIVRKTWGKMSDRAHAAALGLELPEHLTGLVAAALAPVEASNVAG
jgi:hypothetical protein